MARKGERWPENSDDDRSSSESLPDTNERQSNTRSESGDWSQWLNSGIKKKITLRVEGSVLIFRSLDRRVKLGGKLFQKRSKMEGEMGGNHQAKGETRWVNGIMLFRDKHFLNWTRAAYHEDYRKEFIEEDAQKGEFTHTPERGALDGDETSFIDYQKEWGEHESTWDHIVDEEGRPMFRLPGRPWAIDISQHNEYWVHEGAYLLDADNHPLRWLPEINRTFSSALEGWRLDALRKRYPWLLVQDVRARMPRHRLQGTTLLPIQGTEAFTNRAYRFRMKHKIPDWNIRGGTNATRKGKRSKAQAQTRMWNTTDLTEQMARQEDEESVADSASEEERCSRPITNTTTISGPTFANPELAQGGLGHSTTITGPSIATIRSSGAQGRANPNLPRRLHRSSLPLHARPMFDRQMALERARGTAEEDIRLIPLFATAGARDQTALNNRTLTNPWRVARAWRRRDITATGGHLVIRPHNAPRAVDPETGDEWVDVADLEDEDVQRLRVEDEALDGDLDWFDA